MEKAAVIGTVNVDLVLNGSICGVRHYVVLGSIEYDVYDKASRDIVLKKIHLETTAGENAAENLLDGMQPNDMFILQKYTRGWGITFDAEWSYWANGVKISCVVNSQELADFLNNAQFGSHVYYVDLKVLD